MSIQKKTSIFATLLMKTKQGIYFREMAVTLSDKTGLHENWISDT
jgi:hypothetical protein